MTAPEKPILLILGLLLVVSLSLLLVGGETAIWGARAVCVILTILLLAAVWIPAKRFLDDPSTDVHSDDDRD